MSAKPGSTSRAAGTRLNRTTVLIFGGVVVIALVLLARVVLTNDSLVAPTNSAFTTLTGVATDPTATEADDAPIEFVDPLTASAGMEEDPSPSNESLASLASSLQQARHDLGIDEQVNISATPEPLLPQQSSLPRRMAGSGCTFSRCKMSGLRLHVVGNHRVRGLPFTYITIPFRNRLDNLARLVSSINNATTRAQRACMCIQVVDFNTETSLIPSWKNKQCLVTWDDSMGIYMDPQQEVMQHNITIKEISNMMQAHGCDGENAPVFVANTTRESSIPKKYLSSAASQLSPNERAPVLRSSPVPQRLPPVRRAFTAGSSRADLLLPRHVDVGDLNGTAALRYVLGLFDGESTIVNGLKALKLKSPAFSRAGGIAAGVAAMKTPPDSSVVFVCDADMVIRPGFFESMYRYVSLGHAVYYPICWSTCFGMPLSLAPDNSLINVRQWRRGMSGPEPSGYWRHYGTGMLAAFVSDFHAVGGYEDIKRRLEYGKEDGHLYAKFQAAGYRLERRRSQHLVHMYHSKIKDWANSADGMFGSSLGKLGAHVCDTGKFCACPEGSTLSEIEHQLKAAAKAARKNRLAQPEAAAVG